MNKVAHYLQEHLVGEVMTGNDARRYFSTDTSILSVAPMFVVYPRNENDVRKAARFTWQLAERGRVIPITARGAGTDQGGAAIGGGIILAFPAHMNKIVELDTKTGVVQVEPGINYGKLQQTLQTHSRFLPPYPASLEYSTIGGAVGNNASGERSFKYGSTRDFVKGLRVVLANGEVIETRRVSKRELSKKLGLATFEGEIYRAIDTLLEENKSLVAGMSPKVTKNSSGYALDQIKRKDGSFDLTPLFVGSQGTLGIITEVTMESEFYNPLTTVVAALFDDTKTAEMVMSEIRKLSDLPSAMELVDEHLLKFVQENNPNILKGIIDGELPKIMLLVEFDNANDRLQKRLVKKTAKLLKKYEVKTRIETEQTAKDELWRIRHSAATVTTFSKAQVKAVPIIEDGIVPVEKFNEYLEAVYELFKSNGLSAAVWGHAGDANLHLMPMLDLGQVGDRQKAFKLMDEYYKLVLNLGGSITAQNGDGRLRAPYVQQQYGQEVYELFQKIKKICDPYGTMNPGVKIDTTLAEVKSMVREDYDLSHLHLHLPRS